MFDIVLKGGRVIDPETGLDAITNVGITDHRIVEISSEDLVGNEVIDASGLVVAPGFIDLHAHGRTNREQEYQVHDGVTTALELEAGIEFLKLWYQSRKGKALINYGASVNWAFNRLQTWREDYPEEIGELKRLIIQGNSHMETTFEILQSTGNIRLSSDKISETLDHIQNSLRDGGVGIGVIVGYLPGTGVEEIFRVYELAGKLQAPIFTHVRSDGIMAIQQAISDAMLTNAPLHIVHVNSMALGDIELAIEMVQTARDRGYDITTELYPYTAGSTTIQSAIFDEGWQEKLGIGYEDLQWVATGERLTEKTFNEYRQQGGILILHMMKPEWIEAGIASEGVIVASDGMPFAKLAHPRTAGTFSKVLGRYVREKNVLSLNEAIAKMTLLPAKRVEGIAPMMRYKGRIQVGADADITIFNPDEVIDKATFEGGLEFSDGIEYVLVNGVFVVKNGSTAEGVFPGKPIYGKYKR